MVRRGIDVDRRLAKVMVYLKYGEVLTAMKIIDSEGQTALMAEWGPIEQGEWVS